MKRVLVFVVSMAAAVGVPVTAAFAQEGYAPPQTGSQVAPESINSPGGFFSFTGSELVVLIALAVLALALGVGLYAFGRRHSRAAA